MRTMACLFLILLLGILSGRAQPAAAHSAVDQRWIEQLKKTPVDQIEAGLSGASFANWFADRVKPSETGYEVKECQELTNPTASVKPQRLLCIFAYTKPLVPGWNRGIQLDFVVGVLSTSPKGATEVKPVPCRFLIGWDGPSNPQMKRPTYRISKLSELGRPGRDSATRPKSE
jgi:hypothetical protein